MSRRWYYASLSRVGLQARALRKVRLHQARPSIASRVPTPNPHRSLPNMDDHHDHNHNHNLNLNHDLKPQQQSHAPSAFIQDTPPRADVDEILRRKRKAREYKVSVMGVVVHAPSYIAKEETWTSTGVREGKRERGPPSLVCQIGLQDPAHATRNKVNTT
jgi:hypothetical protein